MCLTIPAQVILKKSEKKAVVRLGQKRLVIDTSLVKNIKIQDWVVCNNGTAISKISAREAKQIQKLLASER